MTTPHASHHREVAHRYGTGDPKVVFVERKTHREGWKGEMSVKERFMLKESQVIPFLENRYSVEEVRAHRCTESRACCRHACCTDGYLTSALLLQQAQRSRLASAVLHGADGVSAWHVDIWVLAIIMRLAARTACTAALLLCNRAPVYLAICRKFLQATKEMREKGKPDGEIEAFAQLFTECQKQVDSKQLRPMIRTQYMRTAFQIPFDATVRISLDTNLTMIKESVDEGDGVPLERWCDRFTCCVCGCIAHVSLFACV